MLKWLLRSQFCAKSYKIKSANKRIFMVLICFVKIFSLLFYELFLLFILVLLLLHLFCIWVSSDRLFTWWWDGRRRSPLPLHRSPDFGETETLKPRLRPTTPTPFGYILRSNVPNVDSLSRRIAFSMGTIF